MTTAGDQIMVIYTGMCTSLTCNVSCQRCAPDHGHRAKKFRLNAIHLCMERVEMEEFTIAMKKCENSMGDLVGGVEIAFVFAYNIGEVFDGGWWMQHHERGGLEWS